MSVAVIVAIGWRPELRGLIVTLIGVAVLMGSIYLILGTNLGARLGFMVALCGLSGWMALMGGIWAVYGIGMQGPLGSWQAVEGRTVLQDSAVLTQASVLSEPIEVPDEMSYSDEAALVAEQLVEEEGWEALDTSSPTAGQAGSVRRRVPRGDRCLRGRGVPGDPGVRHRRRPLPDDRQVRSGGVGARAASTPLSRSPRSSRPVPNPGGPHRRARSTRASSASTSTWFVTLALVDSRRSF